jgi:hypothetical protein
MALVGDIDGAMALKTKYDNQPKIPEHLEQHATELDEMRLRIAELEAPKEKKYKGQRIKKDKMSDYHKKALEEVVPDGWCEPKASGNYFTYGIPLRDDGSLIETGYIYNGLRWTTDQFAEAVAACEERADIRSLHYEKGYWHAKTGAIIRGKGGENAGTSRVFVFGTEYDEAALKVEQKNSAHGGEQNLNQTLLRWAGIKGEMSASEWGEHFRSVRFGDLPSAEVEPPVVEESDGSNIEYDVLHIEYDGKDYLVDLGDNDVYDYDIWKASDEIVTIGTWDSSTKKITIN